MSAKVLVVDDNDDAVYILSKALIEEGCSVQVAMDGAQALDKIREEPPDLMLLDLMMPTFNGFALLKTIRTKTDRGNIPIIVVSALSQVYWKNQALDLGANDYLTKPIRVNEVIQKVRQYLSADRRNQNSQNSQNRTEENQ
jgi:DNA-binding response OmpR family regulator